MARVILSPFIKSISGRVGNLEFRTLKSGKTVVHACGAFIPKKAKEREWSPEELESQRRFAMVSQVTGQLQREYNRIDEAAAARQKIWNRVSRHYAKVVAKYPDADYETLRKKLLASLRRGASSRTIVVQNHDLSPIK